MLGTLANAEACILHYKHVLETLETRTFAYLQKRTIETLSRRKACVFTTSAYLINTFESLAGEAAHPSDTSLHHCKQKRALMEA